MHAPIWPTTNHTRRLESAKSTCKTCKVRLVDSRARATRSQVVIAAGSNGGDDGILSSCHEALLRRQQSISSGEKLDLMPI